MRISRRAAMLLPVLLLGGCGQRGALYLPEQERDVVVTPAQGAAATPAPQASPVPADAPATPPAAPDPNDTSRRNNGTQRN